MLDKQLGFPSELNLTREPIEDQSQTREFTHVRADEHVVGGDVFTAQGAVEDNNSKGGEAAHDKEKREGEVPGVVLYHC